MTFCLFLRKRSTVRTIQNYLQQFFEPTVRSVGCGFRLRSGATHTHQPTAPTKKTCKRRPFGKR
jgi:hypothetical protein